MRFSVGAAILGTLLSTANAFPYLAEGWEHRSLAGLSEDTINEIAARDSSVGAFPPPKPQSDTSSKLVDDKYHPYQAPGENDIRGPCPGLNTLANHGYLNRSGIATPQEIVQAVAAGFNMAQHLAMFLAFGAHVVDGNQLTNLLSLGHKTKLTGQDPPSPAKLGGLNEHGLFEGDASTTRGDAYFGNNFSFNETLFQVFVDKSNEYGDGKYNLKAAAEVRWARIQDSMARNPTFDFTTPRYFTAYGESAFPLHFFVDGRGTPEELDLVSARSFFQTNKFPKKFYRREGEHGVKDLIPDIAYMITKHFIQPGANHGAGNYIVDHSEPPLFSSNCHIYEKHVNVTVPTQYPVETTTGALRDALKINLHNFYLGATDGGSLLCPEIFPYGK